MLSKLILFPGLGADARMFERQRAVFPGLVVPFRLAPTVGETLPAYGKRVADHLPVDEPFVIGGASFGGMVAVEAARHGSAAGVILLGSCTHPKGIAPHLYFASLFSGAMPAEFFSAPRLVERALAKKFGAATVEDQDLFMAMAHDADPEFMQWAVTAVARWNGVAELPVPVLSIHGAADRIIPADRVGADHVIADAGHLVNVTHASQVNRLISDFMRSASPP